MAGARVDANRDANPTSLTNGSSCRSGSDVGLGAEAVMGGEGCGEHRSDSGAAHVPFLMAPGSRQKKASRVVCRVLSGHSGCFGITATVRLTAGLIRLIGGGAGLTAVSAPDQVPRAARAGGLPPLLQAIVRPVAHEPVWPS